MAEVAQSVDMEEHLPPATQEENQLAKQAMGEFERGKYDACNATLSRLSQTRGTDPKVIHNKAVVQYFKSGLRRTDEFKKILEDVCLKMRMTLESAGLIDDIDQCTVYYNYAVILYRLQQFHTAIDVLIKVFQFVEPMEKLTQRVVLLLIDLYLATQQPEKAMGMVGYADKNLVNGKSATPEKDGDAAQQRETKENKDMEALRTKISHYKTRCSLMLKNVKLCKREVKALATSLGNSIAMIYIKANLEYLRGNHRKAIKVLNTNPQSQRPTHETGEHVPTMYYNNLGVIHFTMQKPNLGAFYFRKALHENTQIVNEFHKADLSKQLSGRQLQTLGVNRHHMLLYNMGVQLLHCGHPSAAFDCLIETMHLYHISPRLWLRMAECCIMAHKNGNEEDRKLANRLKVVQSSVGSGVHKKLVLGPGLKDEDSKRRLPESPDTPNTTLEFASLCLRNSLVLLITASQPTEATATMRTAADVVLIPAPPGNPMRPVEVDNLRCSVLASSAYVALCLNDHVMALQHARTLLTQPRLSGAHRYLAHMYIAEAQVALDHIADAIQQLNPEAVSDVSPKFPEVRQEQDKGDKNGEPDTTESKDTPSSWYPRDLTTARSIMQYNLATCHAIRGEFEKSLAQLNRTKETIGTPLPAQITALNVYLELMEGRRQAAQVIIKDNFGHMSATRPGA